MTDKLPLQGESAALVFDGLDTFCTVSLNGSEILKTRNMFVPARIDVSDKLKSGDNKLALEFEPSVIRGRMLEEEFGTRETMLGHSSRVYIRMQQSKYGWDWVSLVHLGRHRAWLTELDRDRSCTPLARGALSTSRPTKRASSSPSQIRHSPPTSALRTLPSLQVSLAAPTSTPPSRRQAARRSCPRPSWRTARVKPRHL